MSLKYYPKEFSSYEEYVKHLKERGFAFEAPEGMCKEPQKIEDICQSCKNYWNDLPMPCERYVPHCEVCDKKFGWDHMEEHVPYPCTKCPFDKYEKKDKC